MRLFILVMAILLMASASAQPVIINRVGTENSSFNALIKSLPQEYFYKIDYVEVTSNFIEVDNRTEVCGQYRFNYDRLGRMIKSHITVVDNDVCSKKSLLLHELGHHNDALRGSLILTEDYAQEWRLAHE
jgi:hypothetical protein